MQEKQTTKLEQLKHLKASLAEEVKHPKDFKQAKKLRHLKQIRGKVSKDTSSYASLQSPNT